MTRVELGKGLGSSDTVNIINRRTELCVPEQCPFFNGKRDSKCRHSNGSAIVEFPHGVTRYILAEITRDAACVEK